MHKKIWIFIVSILVIVYSQSAWAVPYLGVATNGPYYSSDPPPRTLTSYQDDWTSQILPAGEGQQEGFAIGNGSTLYLWVTDNGEPDKPFIFHRDIHLLTDATTINGDSNPAPISNMSFNGSPLSESFNNNVDGYKPKPYAGINLGPVLDSSDQLNTGWQTLSAVNPTANGYSGITYVYTGTILFTGTLDGLDHFFTVADVDGNGDYTNGTDIFSPQTTSGVGVPEPATLLLLGSGLVGIGLMRRRIKHLWDIPYKGQGKKDFNKPR